MEMDLRALLALHPAPWNVAAAGSYYAAVDAAGQVVEVTAPDALKGPLVAAVNVASDYLSVIDDLLEESAELAAEDEAAEKAAAERSAAELEADRLAHERYEAVGS